MFREMKIVAVFCFLFMLIGCASTKGESEKANRIEKIKDLAYVDGVGEYICHNISGRSKVVLDSVTFNALNIQGAEIQQCLSTFGTKTEIVGFGRHVFNHDMTTSCLQIIPELKNNPPIIFLEVDDCDGGFPTGQTLQFKLKKKGNRFELDSLLSEKSFQS